MHINLKKKKKIAHYTHQHKDFPSCSWKFTKHFLTVEHLTMWGQVVLTAERVILSRVHVLAPMVLKPRPIPVPADTLCEEAEGKFRLHVGCTDATVFLVLIHQDLAKMNGTPQPNRKQLPALGIEPGSLDHESQPLTIRPFLTALERFDLG